MHSYYLDAIRSFEGFTAQAKWDYAQLSNGYGTRALYAGEVIDKVEAERRFKSEISEARSIVEKAVPHVDEGTKAALTSLTYNAGTAWIGAGLGDAVRSGDIDKAREIFQQYNKAGGEVLPGLVKRRTQEALWIGNADAMSTVAMQLDTNTRGPRIAATSGSPVAASATRAGSSDQAALRIAELIQQRSATQPMSQTNDLRAALERTPKTERLMAGAISGAAGDVLMTLAEVDGLASMRAEDMARLVQLGRGSDLASARTDKDRQDDSSRRA